MRADDLGGLFTGDTQDLRFHQGVITSWNYQTGANTVIVNGATLTDVPMAQQGPESLAIQPGEAVTLFSWKSSYWILGRVTTPGAADFFAGATPNEVSQFVQQNTDVATQTTTVGTGWYSKYLTVWYVRHATVYGTLRVQVAGAAAQGSARLKWYVVDPGTNVDPPWTPSAVIGASPTYTVGNWYFDFEYTWPAGMMNTKVYLSVEVRLTAGTGGVDWAAAQPIQVLHKNA